MRAVFMTMPPLFSWAKNIGLNRCPGIRGQSWVSPTTSSTSYQEAAKCDVTVHFYSSLNQIKVTWEVPQWKATRNNLWARSVDIRSWSRWSWSGGCPWQPPSRSLQSYEQASDESWVRCSHGRVLSGVLYSMLDFFTRLSCSIILNSWSFSSKTRKSSFTWSSRP